MSAADKLNLSVPQCKDINPYVLKNDGWIPQHIAYADRSVYTFLTVYMIFLTLGCTFLNGIIILATWKTKVLRKPFNYIIVNLSLADLLAGIVTGVLLIPANATGYFFMGRNVCVFEGYMLSIFSCTALNCIAVIAFERFVVVCNPFGHVRFTDLHSYIGVASTWIWAIIWNTPPILFWNGYDAEGLGTSCAPNWYVKENGPRIFLVVYFIFGFLSPFAVIVTCYGKLIFKLRQVAKESSSGGRNPESEVSRMVVVMVSAFVVAWLPYASFAMYNVANPDSQIDYSLAALPAFFAKSATLYNPIIYIGLNPKFRDSVIRMFFGGSNPWSEDAGTKRSNSQSPSIIAIANCRKEKQ